MSHTDRNDKQEPRERPFPYIPRGVAIVSTGRANGPDDNAAYVRVLLLDRDPDYARAVARAMDIISDPAEESWGADGGR
jgi:hypothetical protein